ncbi:MAG: hypothetical protein ISR59_03830 [Anaerolineales bacterium]|uniref:Uncharacterized protein n=1 Tax=Candidatus Desulfolinea nitratireducens TaxID=2841698 RepID=A0A8J6NJ27_9CHLR|nr:hypothetical protein [Candidatus Desulfolinea nitratireducens]MBL6960214.1 hypothetical protein [Anaerolineales bacterium]
MMIITEFKQRKYERSQRRFLYLLLLGSGMSMFLPLVWTNYNLQISLGETLSQTALAYQIVLLFFLIVAGFITACCIDAAIRNRVVFFSAPQPGHWRERILYWWGYELVAQDDTQSLEKLDSLTDDIILIEDKPLRPRRRGRKPAFPLERWLPIAAQWESRDSIRDAFTLAELIAEHLGINADGSPVVSEQAYYTTWRDRALEELERRAKKKKKPKYR